VNQEKIKVIKIILEKGKRTLKAAEEHFKNGDYDFASSKAYYAVFYFMQAILYTKDFTFSKHSASIAEFSKSFIKTGIFPKEFGKYIQNLFRERQISDYDFYVKIDLEEAQENLQIARVICEKIENYLDSLLPENLK